MSGTILGWAIVRAERYFLVSHHSDAEGDWETMWSESAGDALLLPSQDAAWRFLLSVEPGPDTEVVAVGE